MNEEKPLEDTIMEVKEDFMLSPANDSEPTLRTAHFLKPISNSIDEPPFKFNSSSSVFDPKEWPLTIHFKGWRNQQEKWVCWIDQLKLKYESVWKKAGIFEAIMSTKSYIHKNQNLLFGVVEKWCCETNTFVFPFGEATITLEDVMVLGGYPILGDPFFTSLEDQEMRDVEKKLILARKEPWKLKKFKATTSIWMDIFINNGSDFEHEAFLVTWLSMFVFPCYVVHKSLFSIAIHLARGNQIALAPAVLASLYKDLSLLKKTIVDLSKYPDGERFPIELTLSSPFYLVQIWVWERFKNLQPQPQTMLINHGDPLLFKWHKVKPLQIDNVRLALDSAIDDFLWRPYVRYAAKCGVFYPNDEILVPFKKDLEKEMLSFVTCLRVCELVGFESIEQYLPHRVAMQFGMDQDVPSYVPRFNETKHSAWENCCRPISDKELYFPPRLFEADVTTRYAKWWEQLLLGRDHFVKKIVQRKQSVLGRDDFVKKIVQRKRSASSRKHRTHFGKANKNGIDYGVPPGFPPNLVDTLPPFMSVEEVRPLKFFDDGSNTKTKTRKVDSFYGDVSVENSVHDGLKDDENIDEDFIPLPSFPPKHSTQVPSIFVEDCKPVLEEFKSGGIIHQCKTLFNQCFSASSSADYENVLLLKWPASKEENGSKEAAAIGDRVAQGESYSDAIRNNVSLSNKVTILQGDHQFDSDMAAQEEAKERVEERYDEVVVMSKEKYLKNQEELARLARQQEGILLLMNLRDKRDEELRKLLTAVLRRNQQFPPSS